MRWWERLPRAARSTAVAEAGVLASKLVEDGVDDAEAIEQLRAVRGGRQALEDLGPLIARSLAKGYPYTRIYRLLRAAADDPLAAPIDRESAAEAEQRRLWTQPFAVSFAELAERVPALAELEQRAQRDPESFIRDLPFRESGLIGGTPPRKPRDRQVRVLMGIDKAVKRSLGPDSGLTDPVLRSDAAVRAAQCYLREAAGIDPSTWRRSAG
jgi:hypothetical protein